MDRYKRVGIDTPEQVFQRHGVDADERLVLRKQLRRRGVLAFFARLRPAIVAMEACGGSRRSSPSPPPSGAGMTRPTRKRCARPRAGLRCAPCRSKPWISRRR